MSALNYIEADRYTFETLEFYCAEEYLETLLTYYDFSREDKVADFFQVPSVDCCNLSENKLGNYDARISHFPNFFIFMYVHTPNKLLCIFLTPENIHVRWRLNHFDFKSVSRGTDFVA